MLKTTVTYPKSTIQTIDGHTLDLANPKPEDIRLPALVRILARKGRFGDHYKWNDDNPDAIYSVGQHAVFVSRLVERLLIENMRETGGARRRLICLAALHHDTHEAYWGFGDIQTPAKHLFGDQFLHILKTHEARFDKVIAERFGFYLDLFHHPVIKQADLIARSTERRDIMPELDVPLDYYYTLEPDPQPLELWPIFRTVEEFLKRHEELTA